MSFRLSALIDDVLANESDARMQVQVDYITGSTPQRLVAIGEDGVDDGPLFRNTFSYGGRQWQVQVAMRDAPGALADWYPWLTFAVGMALTAMLTLLIRVTLNTRYRAESLAHGLSRQARESEYRFRALNELLPALVALVRAADGSIVYFNRAARSLLGVESIDSYRLDNIIADVRIRSALVRVAGRGETMVKSGRGHV